MFHGGSEVRNAYRRVKKKEEGKKGKKERGRSKDALVNLLKIKGQTRGKASSGLSQDTCGQRMIDYCNHQSWITRHP